MTAHHIYYTFGQLAYAIAKADEDLNEKEKEKLRDIFVECLSDGSNLADFSEIIDHVLIKSKKEFESTYNWAMHSLKIHEGLMDTFIKERGVKLLESVIAEIPSKHINEGELLKRFRKDLNAIS